MNDDLFREHLTLLGTVRGHVLETDLIHLTKISVAVKASIEEVAPILGTQLLYNVDAEECCKTIGGGVQAFIDEIEDQEPEKTESTKTCLDPNQIIADAIVSATGTSKKYLVVKGEEAVSPKLKDSLASVGLSDAELSTVLEKLGVPQTPGDAGVSDSNWCCCATPERVGKGVASPLFSLSRLGLCAVVAAATTDKLLLISVSTKHDKKKHPSSTSSVSNALDTADGWEVTATSEVVLPSDICTVSAENQSDEDVVEGAALLNADLAREATKTTKSAILAALATSSALPSLHPETGDSALILVPVNYGLDFNTSLAVQALLVKRNAISTTLRAIYTERIKKQADIHLLRLFLKSIISLSWKLSNACVFASTTATTAEAGINELTRQANLSGNQMSIAKLMRALRPHLSHKQGDEAGGGREDQREPIVIGLPIERGSVLREQFKQRSASELSDTASIADYERNRNLSKSDKLSASQNGEASIPTDDLENLTHGAPLRGAVFPPLGDDSGGDISARRDLSEVALQPALYATAYDFIKTCFPTLPSRIPTETPRAIASKLSAAMALRTEDGYETYWSDGKAITEQTALRCAGRLERGNTRLAWFYPAAGTVVGMTLIIASARAGLSHAVYDDLDPGAILVGTTRRPFGYRTWGSDIVHSMTMSANEESIYLFLKNGSLAHEAYRQDWSNIGTAQATEPWPRWGAASSTARLGRYKASTLSALGVAQAPELLPYLRSMVVVMAMPDDASEVLVGLNTETTPRGSDYRDVLTTTKKISRYAVSCQNLWGSYFSEEVFASTHKIVVLTRDVARIKAAVATQKQSAEDSEALISQKRMLHIGLARLMLTGASFKIQTDPNSAPIEIHKNKIIIGDVEVASSSLPIVSPKTTFEALLCAEMRKYPTVDKYPEELASLLSILYPSGAPEDRGFGDVHGLLLPDIDACLYGSRWDTSNRTMDALVGSHTAERAISRNTHRHYQKFSANRGWRARGMVFGGEYAETGPKTSVNPSFFQVGRVLMEIISGSLGPATGRLGSQVQSSVLRGYQGKTIVLDTIRVRSVKAHIKYHGQHKHSFFTVNDRRIKIDDVLEVVAGLARHTDQKAYDDELDRAAEEGLNHQYLLANGLAIRVRIHPHPAGKDVLDDAEYEKDRDDNENVAATHLEFEHNNNCWYLLIRGERGEIVRRLLIAGGIRPFAKLIQVNYDGKLNNLVYVSAARFMRILSFVDGLETPDLHKLMVNGQRHKTDILARSRKFLQDAIDAVGAEYRDIYEPNFKVSGYVVKGKSGREYIVSCRPMDDSDEDSVHPSDSFGTVYALATKAYICLVDSAGQAGYDKIAGRLLAMANDTYVASKVSTIRI